MTKVKKNSQFLSLLLKFRMNIINKNKKTKQKTRDKEIKETLIDLEKDLNNSRLDIDPKDKTIKEYVGLLEIAKNEYQKVVQENNQLKRPILGYGQQTQQKQKKQIKRKYIIEERDNETGTECESENQQQEEEYPEIKEKQKPSKTKG